MNGFISHPLSSRKVGSFGGMFGMLKGLVGSKSLSQEDMEPVLDKMKDHLIGKMSRRLPVGSDRCLRPVHLVCSRPAAKNVAADIASQLCDSVAKKLEGKVMGTFTSESAPADPSLLCTRPVGAVFMISSLLPLQLLPQQSNRPCRTPWCRSCSPNGGWTS